MYPGTRGREHRCNNDYFTMMSLYLTITSFKLLIPSSCRMQRQRRCTILTTGVRLYHSTYWKFKCFTKVWIKGLSLHLTSSWV